MKFFLKVSLCIAFWAIFPVLLGICLGVLSFPLGAK